MRIGTLFSGGLASAEFALKYLDIKHEVVFGCEWDKYAREQYLYFHDNPTSAFYEDVTDMRGHKYKNSIDLMVWGSPCQDISLAGNRKGLSGSKSSMFYEGARVQSEVMPKVFIFENVKGLLSSNGGADLKVVLQTFTDMGYRIQKKVLNTKDFGIPQNRERLFIVGFLDDSRYDSFNFPEVEPLELRLRDVLEDDVDDKYTLSEKMINALINKNNNFNGSFKPKDIDEDTANCIDTKEGNRRTNNYIPIKSATKRGYEVATKDDSINFTDIINPLKGKTEYGWHFEQNVYSFESPMIRTLMAGQGSGSRAKVIIRDRIRRLTPKETFRLQGVRDEDIDLVISDTQAYKISGNAITVDVMMRLIDNIVNPKTSVGLF